jgi:hypothetical protein
MSAQKVPLIDLQAQFAPLREGVLDAIARVCDAQHFILGPEVEALERELEAFLGIPHAVGVSSGTDALLAALMALDVGPGEPGAPAMSSPAGRRERAEILHRKERATADRPYGTYRRPTSTTRFPFTCSRVLARWGTEPDHSPQPSKPPAKSSLCRYMES